MVEDLSTFTPISILPKIVFFGGWTDIRFSDGAFGLNSVLNIHGLNGYGFQCVLLPSLSLALEPTTLKYCKA